ncbi:MAG: C4-dicarboxylate ABC transporter substrate-binding protein [Spirochaetes bacterium]|nr:MAG: C4-dicarboxylate ABC transporter substrate-binding protein [Spirochaetota bacterium]
MNMKALFRKSVLLIVLVFAALAPLSALTVKLGSPFPEGSSWDSSLKRMAAQWSEISGGQVRLRIYPGGVAGDQADMIRKMRIGQLDAAVLTSFGLKSIVPDTFVLSLPGLLKSEAELNYVIEEFVPQFDDDFVKEGFRILAWSKSGWAYFFAKSPARTPRQLMNEKLSVSAADEEAAVNFISLGFNVVPTSLNELMVALQSGMVTAFYGPPMAAAAYQWFALAPYMIDFPLAPVLGGFVVSERTWNRIPERYHAELKAAIEEVAADFYTESERLNIEAMNVMKRHGLKVEELNADEMEQWYDLMNSGHHLLVGDGKWIDEDLYNNLVSSLKGLR